MALVQHLVQHGMLAIYTQPCMSWKPQKPARRLEGCEASAAADVWSPRDVERQLPTLSGGAPYLQSSVASGRSVSAICFRTPCRLSRRAHQNSALAMARFRRRALHPLLGPLLLVLGKQDVAGSARLPVAPARGRARPHSQAVPALWLAAGAALQVHGLSLVRAGPLQSAWQRRRSRSCRCPLQRAPPVRLAGLGAAGPTPHQHQLRAGC